MYKVVFLVMIDCTVLQLFFLICSFLDLTLFCIITGVNFRSVCSSLAVVMLLNILSVLECNVCMFLLKFTAYCFYYHYLFTMDAFCLK